MQLQWKDLAPVCPWAGIVVLWWFKQSKLKHLEVTGRHPNGLAPKTSVPALVARCNKKTPKQFHSDHHAGTGLLHKSSGPSLIWTAKLGSSEAWVYPRTQGGVDWKFTHHLIANYLCGRAIGLKVWGWIRLWPGSVWKGHTVVHAQCDGTATAVTERMCSLTQPASLFMGVCHTSFKDSSDGHSADCLKLSSLAKVTSLWQGEQCQKEDCDFAMGSTSSKGYPQITDALILDLLREATVRIKDEGLWEGPQNPPWCKDGPTPPVLHGQRFCWVLLVQAAGTECTGGVFGPQACQIQELIILK